MSLKSSLIDLPYVEFWLIPVIFALIVGLIAQLDSQPTCPATCPCIENTP